MNNAKKYLDTIFITQFKNGDEDAFTTIFNYYKNHVYWLGIHFFKNEEQAKDLVQYVFLDIYKNIKKLKDDSCFYVWMNRIAYTRCLQMFRYNKKDSLHYLNDLGEDSIEDVFIESDTKSVMDEIESQRVKEIIVETLETLSVEQRTIAYLRFFEELSWSEISEVMNIPVSTASSTLTRVKPILKKALEKGGFSSASCLGILSISNMSQYMVAFAQEKGAAKGIELTANSLLALSTATTTTVATMSLSSLLSLSAFVLLPLALVTTIVVFPREEGNSIFDFNNPAKIVSIDYEKEYTNKPITLNVNTTNAKYDAIYINNEETRTIHTNGNYQVALVREGKVVDTQEVKITNIDLDIPTVLSEKTIGNEVEIRVEDKESGIHYEGIKYYKNSVEIPDFIVNKDGKIILKLSGFAEYKVEIPDCVGNVQLVTIKVLEKDK